MEPLTSCLFAIIRTAAFCRSYNQTKRNNQMLLWETQTNLTLSTKRSKTICDATSHGETSSFFHIIIVSWWFMTQSVVYCLFVLMKTKAVSQKQIVLIEERKSLTSKSHLDSPRPFKRKQSAQIKRCGCVIHLLNVPFSYKQKGLYMKQKSMVRKWEISTSCASIWCNSSLVIDNLLRSVLSTTKRMI